MGLFSVHHTVPAGSFCHKYLPYSEYPFEVSFLRKITIFCIAFFYFLSTTSVICIIFNWDMAIFLDGGFSIAVSIFESLVCYIGLSIPDNHTKIMELKKELWSFEDADSEVYKRIANKYALIQKTRAIVTIATILVIILCLPITGDYREGIPLAYIIEDEDKQKTVQVFLMLTITLPRIYYGFLVLNVVFLVIFLMYDMSTHFVLIREKLKSMEKTYGKGEHLFYDEAYQNNVDTVLRQCISQHILILRYVKIVRKEIERYVLITVLTGVVCLAFLYSTTKKHTEILVLLRCSAILLLGAVLAFNFCTAGQTLSDECDRLHQDLFECQWFLWKRSNKNTYLVFLIGTKDPIVFESLDLTVNLNFLIIVLRRTLSFIAGLERLTGRN